MIKAAVIGSTGYIGQELVRLLMQHPEVDLSYVTSQSYVGKEYKSVYRNFEGIFLMNAEEDIEKISREMDIMFIALPTWHGFCKSY